MLYLSRVAGASKSRNQLLLQLKHATPLPPPLPDEWRELELLDVRSWFEAAVGRQHQCAHRAQELQILQVHLNQITVVPIQITSSQRWVGGNVKMHQISNPETPGTPKAENSDKSAVSATQVDCVCMEANAIVAHAQIY